MKLATFASPNLRHFTGRLVLETTAEARKTSEFIRNPSDISTFNLRHPAALKHHCID